MKKIVSAFELVFQNLSPHVPHLDTNAEFYIYWVREDSHLIKLAEIR
jgi:hypothetical protein